MKSFTTGVAVLALLAQAACSSHKSTIQTRDGSATVTTSQDGKSVTIQTNQGTMAIGQNVDARKLGAPIYPGAQANQQEGLANDDAKGSTVVAAFTTADDFEKVYGFYKQRLPAGAEKMKVDGGNGSVASFQVGGATAPDQVTVQVSSHKPGETDVLITHVTKSSRSSASSAPVESPAPESSS